MIYMPSPIYPVYSEAISYEYDLDIHGNEDDYITVRVHALVFSDQTGVIVFNSDSGYQIHDAEPRFVTFYTVEPVEDFEAPIPVFG